MALCDNWNPRIGQCDFLHGNHPINNPFHLLNCQGLNIVMELLGILNLLPLFLGLHAITILYGMDGTVCYALGLFRTIHFLSISPFL